MMPMKKVKAYSVTLNINRSLVNNTKMCRSNWKQLLECSRSPALTVQYISLAA